MPSMTQNRKAMNEEFDVLIDNHTWDPVPQTSNANVIRFLWIYG